MSNQPIPSSGNSKKIAKTKINKAMKDNAVIVAIIAGVFGLTGICIQIFSEECDSCSYLQKQLLKEQATLEQYRNQHQKFKTQPHLILDLHVDSLMCAQRIFDLNQQIQQQSCKK